MEGAERDHLLLQVLQDDAVHPRAELGRGLPIARVVREPAARGLELARVEDELARRPRAARLGARGRVGVRVGGVRVGGVRGSRRVLGCFRCFQFVGGRSQRARGDEPRVLPS